MTANEKARRIAPGLFLFSSHLEGGVRRVSQGLLSVAAAPGRLLAPESQRRSLTASRSLKSSLVEPSIRVCVAADTSSPCTISYCHGAVILTGNE